MQFTLNSDRFPVGTSVGAYLAEDEWRGAGTPPPTQGPKSTAADTSTVASSGSCLFTGLEADSAYWAVALVSGSYRWVRFRTDPSLTARYSNSDPEDVPVRIDSPADQIAAAFEYYVGDALAFSIDADGYLSGAEAYARASRLDLNIKDYTGIDDGGTTDVAAVLATAGAAAKQIAIDEGYDCVRVGGFGRGKYRVDTGVLFYDRVLWDFGDATIFAGADMPTTSLIRTPVPAVGSNTAIGTGDTTNGSQVITSVTNPATWTAEDRITGTGIPAGTKVIAVDVLNSRLLIDAAATATNAGVTLTRSGGYYGSFRRCGMIGGKLDPNGKQLGGATVRALWTDDFLIDGTEVVHNQASGYENWAFQIGGRRGYANHPKVTGGTKLFQDGLHLVHGQRWEFVAPDIESGDDALAFGAETGEASLAALPDPVRHVTVTAPCVRSLRGSGIKIYVPVGGSGRDWQVTDLEVLGITGHSGILRNGGILILDQVAGGIGSSQIKRCRVTGALAVGSPGHDGTNPYGLQVLRGEDITIDMRFDIDCTAHTFTAWYADLTDNLVLLEGCRTAFTSNAYVLTSFLNGARIDVRSDRPSGLSAARSRSLFLDDFLGIALDSTKWASHLGSDGDCAVALKIEKGGTVELVSGNDAGATMALNGAQLDSALEFSHTQGSNRGSLFFEARVNLGGGITNICAFVGLTDQNSGLEMPFTRGAADALTSNASNAIGFLFDTAADTDDWWAVSVNADTDKINEDLGVAPTQDVFETFGFEIDINGRVTLYRNGTKIGTTYAGGAVGTVALTPVLAVFSRTGSQRRLRCDYVRLETARAD